MAEKRISLPVTKIIHENISVLMNFCYARKPLEMLVDRQFTGEWKYLHKALFETSELAAEKACIELAVFMRLLDDEVRFSDYLRESNPRTFGLLLLRDGSQSILGFRDVCNKIIHAQSFSWEFPPDEIPVLICRSRQPERWVEARIHLVQLVATCGQFMS